MFSLLAIFAIVASAGAIPIIIAWLFVRPSWDDRERESLAIAVEVEKNLTSWRARHQTPDQEF